ncbi:MAG TPA: GGDEF domain-containing protein [Treponemataceae bacterium]|nr:GGDEF domain-containing protein [Treponemataceae bacterium]
MIRALRLSVNPQKDSTEFLPMFIRQRIEENLIRFTFVPYLVLVLSFLFSLEYFFEFLNGTISYFEIYICFLFAVISLVSVLFCVIVSFFSKSKNRGSINLLIFFYVAVLMLAVISISVLNSSISNDSTAIAIFFLGVAFFYRSSSRQIVLLLVIGILFDTFLFYAIFSRIDVVTILSLIAILGFSFTISRVQERMHVRLFDALQKLESMNLKLQEESVKDPLTNLHNRRYMYEFLLQQLALFTRTKKLFSIIMCDIDHFKLVNDEYGHPVGDEVIKAVTRIVTQYSRESDVQARYGGEEFVVILPQTDAVGARIVAERMRIAIQEYHFQKLKVPITCSFGITEVQSGDTTESLIKRVDSFLYCAKHGGRNTSICG